LEESEIFGVSMYSLKGTMSKKGVKLLQVGLEQCEGMNPLARHLFFEESTLSYYMQKNYVIFTLGYFILFQVTSNYCT
jgi:predicted transcriptional regulator